VNTQVGDLKRIPFILPSETSENIVATLASNNVNIKKELNTFRIFETNFAKNPLLISLEGLLKDRILSHLSFENRKYTEILINETIINEKIFDLYELNAEDINQVKTKTGQSVGGLPVVEEAKRSFFNEIPIDHDVLRDTIMNLDVICFDDQHYEVINAELNSLFQNNNNLEEFCIRHQVNPINVWYWFKESNILPQGRAHDISMEFIADVCRTILMDDEDGIIPLVGLPNEPKLLDRLEHHCLQNGFTSAQFMQLDGLLGHPLNEFIEHHFFKNFSDHLNLFMYLPKTPFIWHLSSGEHHGFEAYIIIYKWNISASLITTTT